MKAKTSNKTNVGHALLVGVSTLDETHYAGQLPVLNSPTKDVADFELICKLNGFEVLTLNQSSATKQAFNAALGKIAKTLKGGDTFLLMFAGYGGIVPSYGNRSQHKYATTWCLYESQLLYAEVVQGLALLHESVDVLVLSDCSSPAFGYPKNPIKPNDGEAQRALPVEIAQTIYLKNKDYYDAISLGNWTSNQVAANVLWLHACQPNQHAHENTYNGLMIAAMKHVWNGGCHDGDFEQFLRSVSLRLPPHQSIKHEFMGGSTQGLMSKPPFSI